VTIRLSVRVAGLAILAAQVATIIPQVGRPGGLVALAFIILIEFNALMWSTRPDTVDALKVMAPAALTGVTAAAIWTVLAFIAPDITTSDTFALIATASAGILVAVRPPRGTTRRLTAALTASATTALLTFVAISRLLPTFDGYVTNWYPPTGTTVTRLVDPILEFAVFVVLTIALYADLMWVRARTRRTWANDQHLPDEAGPNEMIVVPTNPGARG
jgi:hypothetical protein